MTRPWLDDGDVSFYHGDALSVLAGLPAGSVQTCVTSPPYWGLRDYGTGAWEGGALECDHLGPPMRTNNKPVDSEATFHGGCWGIDLSEEYLRIAARRTQQLSLLADAGGAA